MGAFALAAIMCVAFPRLPVQRGVPPPTLPSVRGLVRLDGAPETSHPSLPEIEPEDQTNMAINFFSSERTPASLISGAALSVLFVFPLIPGENIRLGVAKRVYITFVCSAFCNSLLSVFTASLAIVRLLAREHNGVARDPQRMMYREVPLYFLAVQAHFLTGLLCFAAALSIRMWAEYFAGCAIFSRAMVSMLAGTVMLMVSLFNRSLAHHKSFVHLWGDYIGTFARDLARRTRERGPSLCAFLGIALLALAFFDLGTIAKKVTIKLLTGQGNCTPNLTATPFGA